MKFKKYNSIEYNYRVEYIKKIRNNGYDSKDIYWHVTEKIHGSNFSFITNGETVECQKRTSILKNEKFYNWQCLKEQYEENILNMFSFMNRTMGSPLETLYVYGELFGGHYPHKDVKQYNASIKIQKGIYYHPGNEFMAFDIFAVFKDGNARWLELNEIVILCIHTDIETVPLLKIGTFDECLDYSNDFQTKVPNVFGLPEIDNNICEGVVIKPNKPLYIGQDRIIIKNKNDKWKEKAKEPKKKKQPIVITEDQQKYIDEYSKYLTVPRFQNAASKIGEPDFKLFSDFVKEIYEDAMKDFKKDNEEEIMKKIPDKHDRKIIIKQAGKMTADFVRECILKIIKGDF